MSKRIGIIDYDVGNTHSIKNALNVLGYKVVVSRKEIDLVKSDALILPGVGAFGEAMGNLKKFGLIDILNDLVLKKKKPILGICLGMQILGKSSEEDPGCAGLGWIDGVVNKITAPGLRIPHVGWNHLKISSSKPLFERHEEESHYYFDHSYHFICDPSNVAATSVYGSEITAAVQKDNIHGVQFHPEKSHKSGLKLFRSFFNSFDF